MYFYFPQMLKADQCDMLNQFAFEKLKNNQMECESQKECLGRSYGIGGLPPFEGLLHQLTPIIENATGIKGLEAQNSFVRFYFNGGKMLRHVDRAGLDITLSLCTYSNIEKPWPLYFEVDGKIASVNTQVGDGVMIAGTKMHHWRDDLICNEDQFVIQSFYHWRIS